jgi:hypothetical protein
MTKRARRTARGLPPAAYPFALPDSFFEPLTLPDSFFEPPPEILLEPLALPESFFDPLGAVEWDVSANVDSRTQEDTP